MRESATGRNTNFTRNRVEPSLGGIKNDTGRIRNISKCSQTNNTGRRGVGGDVNE